MNCSDCVKQDVCPHRARIFEAFHGILDNLFEAVNQVKYNEIAEFIFNSCQKKVTYKQVEAL